MQEETPTRRKAVRLEDIGRHVDVSTATASMALAGSARVSPVTRRKVLEACRDLGYRPPRTRRRRAQTRTTPRIGLLIIGTQVNNPVNIGLVHHLTSQGTRRGIRLEVATIESTDASSVADQALRFAAPCDALLLAGELSGELMRKLTTAELRFAALGLPRCQSQDPEPPSGVVIAADDRMMGERAARCLLARGHRRIAFVAEVLSDHASHERWFEGYCLAHQAMDVAIDRGLVNVVGIEHDELPAAVMRMTESQAPTAAIVTDLAAVGPLLRALSDRGVLLEHRDTMAWGSADLAKLYGLRGLPMIGIDAQRWADAALRHVLSPPETRLGSGTIVYVPYETWNLSD